MKLYNIDGCGYCAMVREVLTQMSLDYEKIDVPWPHHQRQEVHEISGQTTVPVLVDGDTIPVSYTHLTLPTSDLV